VTGHPPPATDQLFYPEVVHYLWICLLQPGVIL
jgi:hypothetical protein